MGPFGPSEIIFLFILALIVFGPKKLPEIGKTLGKGMREFKKATDILSGLWEKVRERPGAFLDPRTIEAEGLDAAARDFLAGMTDRYAVRLFEQLFIPKPWAIE